jgi:hypothetical protein
MAPEIPLDQQRPADFVYSRHVETMLAQVQRKNDPVKALEVKPSTLAH